MTWRYDDPFGWFSDEEREDDADLLIFNETADHLFGPPAETPCSEPWDSTAIAGISDSGRHHRVEAAD
jgi:hypothetical protein